MAALLPQSKGGGKSCPSRFASCIGQSFGRVNAESFCSRAGLAPAGLFMKNQYEKSHCLPQHSGLQFPGNHPVKERHKRPHAKGGQDGTNANKCRNSGKCASGKAEQQDTQKNACSIRCNSDYRKTAHLPDL